MLPNFICIGAQRSGTTLLHNILSDHTEVFVPRWRKEIHYFDRYYDRGPGWYGRFFPDDIEGRQFRAIGEVTPDYLFESEVPRRIAALIPNCRFIISLRNPVDRAFSGYMHHRRSFNERRSFDEFVNENREVIQRGLYHMQIVRYLEYFPRSALLILVYEEVILDPAFALERLRTFLGLDRGWPDPPALLAQRVNAARLPRYPTGFYWARRLGGILRRHDVDWVVETAKRLGVPAAFGQKGSAPRMSTNARARLNALYGEDIAALEKLLQRDLAVWREPSP